MSQVLPADHCENCFRHGIDTELVEAIDLCQKSQLKYNNMIYVRGRDRWLCQLCESYIFEEGTAKLKAKYYWPAMVGSYLFRNSNDDPMLKQETMPEKWSIIPMEWRSWWLSKAQTVDPLLSLTFPESKFVLVTKAYQELMRAIGKLEWLSLSKAIDKHLSHPSVRCPFGCSEFLHKTNRVVMEDLLTIRSNGSLNSYSDMKNPGWTSAMKPNFPSKKAILDDSDFWCNPCLIVDEHNGLEILTCRYHSQKSRLSYLHVPESPTGTLCTSNSNRFAPAKLRTRTIRSAKLNGFSDTYELAMLQGGFDGVDSTYVSTTARYDIHDKLADKRDSLSISGRDDMYYHVLQLSGNKFDKNYLPQRNVDDKLLMAREEYGNVSAQCKKELAAATFIPLSQAVDIQEGIYNDTDKVIKIYKIPRESNDMGQEKLYKPKWPTRIVGVHPNDNYGCRFGAIKDVLDSFSAWITVGAVACVPELWTLLCKSMEDNLGPYGYILSYAWKMIKKTSSDVPPKDPFSRKLDKDKEKNEQMLREILGISGGRAMNWKSYLRFTFATVDEVVIIDREVEEDSIPETANIMFVTGPRRGNFMPASTLGCWELRYVAHKKNNSTQLSWDGVLFARHGNDIGSKWWKQTSKAGCFFKATKQLLVERHKPVMWVYVRTDPNAYIELRKRYFATMNGQSTIYCEQHKLPLITNYTAKLKEVINDNDINQGNPVHQLQCCYEGSIAEFVNTWTEKRCNCENKKVNWVCPRSGCGIAVCDSHFKTAIQRGEDQMYLLSKETCITCEPEDLAYTFVDRNYNDMPPTHPVEPTLEQIEEDNDYLTSIADDNLLFAATENSIDEYDHGPTEGFQSAEMLYMDNDIMDEQEESNLNAAFDTEGYYTNTPFHQSQDNNHEENDFVFEGPQEISSFPFHVLTNKNGHLLTRRNAKLRMNKKHENAHQKLCANSAGNTLPFVYAEALLFPDIFFKSEDDGTILGAIPTGLWADASILNKFGVASMKTHAQTRIFDPALLCSTDSRYHFMMFDCLANLGLRGQDSRFVLHRGFADRQGENEGVAYKTSNGNNEIYGESVDDQANVHKLCALTGKSMPHFFITQSCNQRSLRGLRIFRKWLQDEQSIQNVMKKHNVDHAQAKHMLRLSASVVIARTWDVISDLWMQYIFQSPEEPLGPIEWSWWRKEFQDETGNVSHIHGIAKSKLDTSIKANLDKLLNMIRGNLADLVHYEEAIEYKRKGYIDSLSCLTDILQDAAKYLPHTCHSRCQVPRMEKNGETSYYCKVPNNYLMTPTPQMHTMVEVNVEYSPRAMEILVQLGMATYSNYSLTTIEITNERLKMIRHVPKTSNAGEKFSPTNGLLFVLYPSSQNLQFCTGMSINAYLTKYAAGIDKVSILSYTPPTRGSDGNLTKVKYHSLNNTKITAVRIHNNKKRKLANTKKKSPEQNARLLTQTELLSVIAGEKLVKSTVEFKFMQTSPREFRAATDKKGQSTYDEDRPDDAVNLSKPPNVVMREEFNFPLCRQFSRFQQEVIEDELESPLKLDSVTLFSMRPPELRFVNMLSLYTEWFEREAGPSIYKTTESIDFIAKGLNKSNFTESLWIDGFNGVMRIRYAALNPCLEWAMKTEPRFYGEGNGAIAMKRKTVTYLKKLIRFGDCFVEKKREGLGRRVENREEWTRMLRDHLTRLNKKLLPVVWITPVYPRRKHAFLIQLLLCFGRFETEYEIMLSSTLKGAFEKAGLLDTNDPHSSVHQLMNLYVNKHLSTFPGSKYQFARCLIESNTHIKNLFLEQESVEDFTPPVLQSHIMESMDEKIAKYFDATKVDLIERTHEDLVKCGLGQIIPQIDVLRNARKKPLGVHEILFFPPDASHNRIHQQASRDEQSKVMELAKSSVEDYINPSSRHMNLIICGGPGVGKTTVCQLTCMYVLSRGLNMITTSLVARRSKELGGIHYHRLLSSTESGRSFSPGRQAEKTLAKLYRKPHVIELLRSLDSLFVDELGLFSAEQMAVLDIILRYIKHSSLYMGGIFVFGTIDVMQLMTFKGTPFLMSGFILTDYRFIELKHSVRAANDPVLQEICNMTRMRQWTNSTKGRFKQLLSDNCNFLNSIHDSRLPEDAVFVFGKKAPCREAENIMLDRMKRIHANNYLFSKAIDQESTTAGNWRPASTPTKNILNNRLKRKQQLMFYPRARYEFTYNDENIGFMQGQLAYMLEIPPAENITDNKPILLYASPPGCKNYPQGQMTSRGLTELGWYPVNVPYTTSQTEQISNGMQGRRSQYGLRPRVASTIHAAMGSTLPSVVTALVPINGSTSDFGLWDPAQVVVLLSRTEYAKDIYFIGDKSDTIKSLLQTLQKSNLNLNYINSLLEKLCSESVYTPVYNIPSRYCSQDAVVPNSPGVYILASTKQPDYFYIGQTANLSNRLDCHNRGLGPLSTRQPYLRPWGMLGFVTGFLDSHERLKFESIWKVKFRNVRSTTTPTAEDLLNVAVQMCEQNNSENSSSLLRFVRTGRINAA